MKLTKLIQSLQNAKEHFGKSDPDIYFSAIGSARTPSELDQIVDCGPLMFLDREVMVVSGRKIKHGENMICPTCGADTLPVVGASHRVCGKGDCDYGTVYL